MTTLGFMYTLCTKRELRANAVTLPALRASLLVIAAVAAAAGVALPQVAEAATVTLKTLEKRKAFILNLFENQQLLF